MEKGISTAILWPSTPEEAILFLKKHGYKKAEFSVEHADMLLERCGGSWMKGKYNIVIGDKTSPDGKTPEDIGHEFGEFLKENDFSIPQAHLMYLIDNSDPKCVDVHLRWIDMYLAMGVKNLVIHAQAVVGDKPTPEKRAQIIENFKKIVKRLDGTDAYLCIENTRYGISYTVDEILAIIEEAGNDSHFGICCDTGHLNLALNKGNTTQSHLEFILKAGNRLHALHIANNDGSDDMHCLPFNLKAGSGRLVNWQEVMTALKEVKYNDLFNFEVPGESRAPAEVMEMKMDYISKLADYMLEKM